MPYSYAPLDPEITRAYQNDPRTKLAAQLIQSGSSTSPLAQGKYAWMDGIARALSGVAGGFAQKGQQKKYEKQEDKMYKMYAAALGSTPDAQGSSANQGTAPATGLEQQPGPPAQEPGGGSGPAQSGPLSPADVMAQGQPQMPPQGLPVAQQAPDPLAPLPDAQAAPQGLPQAPMIAAALGAPKPQQPPVVQAMLPITRGTESRNRDFGANGRALTSPKGAKYAMQTMPSTAGDPGFGVKPAQSDTPAEYNRVGTEYLDKMMQRYGDPAKAWAAYNAGPGRVDKKVAKHGDNWLSHMPAETQDYVATNMAALGDGAQPGQATKGEGDAFRDSGPMRQMEPLPAEPDLPGMPNRPADRGAVQSSRLAAGRKLMQSGNRYVMATAMRMIEDGMGEQFSSDREALQAARGLDETGYTSGLNNRYQAENQQRGARFDERRDARNNNFQREQTEDAQQYGTGERQAGQQFQTGERQAAQAFTAGESALDRGLNERLTKMTIEGKKETAAMKVQNFLGTPQGSRMYNEVSAKVSQNDNIIAALDQFQALNAKQATGGFTLNTPIVGAVPRILDGDLQQMDQITNTIAPLIRQAGSGSMSDRDVEMFKQSIPNVKNGREANQASVARVKNGMQRINDFEMSRMLAASEGRQAQFMREWSVFKSKVSINSGQTFDEWKASVPQYGADGSRK